ncbi:UPF0178 protein [Propionispora sp. 2/2-37]|uniref:YaiI/YqxD family protein n=1 Tax=Propionispora sp. 2/2-37 TaxID=1677858 RepID=UPI0006BB9220|nr:DUF188 domain-containing protein [Propionispora sp. 2/2-37]CUH96522.1 UPF0178 protein [Propionispora sp. 2/2-37]
MKIIVDADACPKTVLSICKNIGGQYVVPVWTVASFHHVIESDHHIVVGGDSQEADLKVINLTQAGDLVITQDWGLAAMVLGKGAAALSPGGREYRPGQMDFMLEERELKAKLRRSGGRTRGPKKRTAENDQAFEAALGRLLEKLHTTNL